jgi:hypothetical protein
MKNTFLKIVFSALMFSGLNIKAQDIAPVMPVDPETKLITYKEVVTVEGTRSELFNRAIGWVNKQYKNPVDATKVRDQASGIIEIIHRIELTKEEKGVAVLAGTVDYSMKLELKDGRYRFTITNFNSKSVSRKPIEPWMNKDDSAYLPVYENYLKQVNDYMLNLIAGLKLAMLAPAAKKPDTW